MEVIKSVFYIIGFLLLTQCSKPKPAENSDNGLKLSATVLPAIDEYFSLFENEKNLIRFIQILDSQLDSTRIVLHAFGGDSYLLKNYSIISVDSIHLGKIYIGIAKNCVFHEIESYENNVVKLREYCPRLIVADSAKIIRIDSCFRQRIKEESVKIVIQDE
jgi:hypothetical protein